MNKIGIPISGDTFVVVGMSCIMLLLIGLFGVVEIMIFENGGFYYLLLIPVLLLQYIMIMFLFIVHNKDEWIDKMIPFRFTR